MPAHEQRACPSSTSREALEERRRRLQLGAAQRGSSVATTATRVQRWVQAPVYLTPRDSMERKTLRSATPGSTFRGFFDACSAPAAAARRRRAERRLRRIIYYDATSIMRLCDVVYWPRQPGSSSTSAPIREEQTPARLRTRSGFRGVYEWHLRCLHLAGPEGVSAVHARPSSAQRASLYGGLFTTLILRSTHHRSDGRKHYGVRVSLNV